MHSPEAARLPRLGHHHPFDRLDTVLLAPQCLLKLRQKSGYPFPAFYGLEGDAVDTRTSLVGANQAIGVSEDARPIHLVVERVKAKGRFLLGLALKASSAVS